MEVWNKVTSYGGVFSTYYEVSSFGRVRSLDRIVTVSRKGKKYTKLILGVMLTPTLIKDGYLQVALHCLGNAKSPVIHRLVADAFIEKIAGKDLVNHLDGKKTNNHKDNLAWCTHLENMQHACEMGLRTRGEDHHLTTLTNQQVLEICDLLDSKTLSTEQIADKYFTTPKVIHNVHLGNSWDWLTKRTLKVTPSDHKGKNNPSAKAVINCRGEIFDTMQEAGIRYGTSWTGISRVVRGNGLHAGKYNDNTPIKWKYYKKQVDNLD